MQTAFPKKPRAQKKNELEPPAISTPETPQNTPATAESEQADTLDSNKLIDGPEPVEDQSSLEAPQIAPVADEKPKTYSLAEREAFAKELLPPDVILYLKEEFRAEFNSVRSMKDRKLF